MNKVFIIENYFSGDTLNSKMFKSESQAIDYLYETLDFNDEEFDDWSVVSRSQKQQDTIDVWNIAFPTNNTINY